MAKSSYLLIPQMLLYISQCSFLLLLIFSCVKLRYLDVVILVLINPIDIKLPSKHNLKDNKAICW